MQPYLDRKQHRYRCNQLITGRFYRVRQAHVDKLDGLAPMMETVDNKAAGP